MGYEIVHQSVITYASNLKLHLFVPDQTTVPNSQRPALIFFHGGRFIQGHPAQFFPHCRYFASRGAVAASAEYRLLGKNAVSVLDCMSDCRNAIKWLRRNRQELSINPQMIVAAGGSAGANLAANAAFTPETSVTADTTEVSSRPDALILFSPAIIPPNSAEDLIDERLYASLTPSYGLPPMLLLHGAEDEIFDTTRMQKFTTEMRHLANRVELNLYPGGKHGYFNHGRDGNRPFYETVIVADSFLCELGFLSGEPNLNFVEIESLRHQGDWQS